MLRTVQVSAILQAVPVALDALVPFRISSTSSAGTRMSSGVHWVTSAPGEARHSQRTASWQVGRGRPLPRHGRFVAKDLTDPELRFDRMAEAVRVREWRVEEPDDLAQSLRSALAHPGPSLVDVAIEAPLQ